MDPQISILFYVGVITPTVVTIGFFIGFLICWYRCDLRTHLLNYKSQIQCTSSDEKKEGKQNYLKNSRYSSQVCFNRLHV